MLTFVIELNCFSFGIDDIEKLAVCISLVIYYLKKCNIYMVDDKLISDYCNKIFVVYRTFWKFKIKDHNIVYHFLGTLQPTLAILAF